MLFVCLVCAALFLVVRFMTGGALIVAVHSLVQVPMTVVEECSSRVCYAYIQLQVAT